MKSTFLFSENLLANRFLRVAILLVLAILFNSATCPPGGGPLPRLSVFPTSLDFGANEKELTFKITNTGSGKLVWNTRTDKPWIKVSPDTGSATAEEDQVVVTVDRSIVNRGTHVGSVQVNSNGGTELVSISMTKVGLIEAALKNDTAPRGETNNDGITSDPTIKGRLVSRKKVHKLDAQFLGNDFSTDITSTIEADGNFLLDSLKLNRINAGPLEDGPYTLRLKAEDQNGITLDSTDTAFTLDTTRPRPVLFEPWDGGVTNLQRGFIDVAVLDLSKIEPTTITSQNLIIRNGDNLLQVVKTKVTSDSLYRYYYYSDSDTLKEGPVYVTFLDGQITDIAGNVNTEQIESFEFASFPPIFNGPGQRPRGLQIEPNINDVRSENSVFYHSGEAFLSRVDLEIPGRGFNWRFERTYRSGLIYYVTPLGYNWDHNYNRRLLEVTSANKNLVQFTFPNDIVKVGDIVRMDGLGREDLYVRVVDLPDEVTNRFVSPIGFYTNLTEIETGLFVERDKHGNVITYKSGIVDDPAMNVMISIVDRNANTMLFEYNDSGQLQFVIDTMGRKIEYFYDVDRLTKVRDFFDREIILEYNTIGTILEAVTSPRVVGTPHGNDFPEGKTERYTYVPGTTIAPLLYEVIAPNEVANSGMPREVYIYGFDDAWAPRVIEHTYGGTNSSGVPAGGTFKYTHLYQTQPGIDPGNPDELKILPRTIVTDRNGNLKEYEFNPLGNATIIREYTNRDVRASDPYRYESRHEYDEDGQRLTITYHEGNEVEYFFDRDNPDRFQQGNLLRTTRRPDTDRSGDQAEIVTKYSYEPIYNQKRSMTEARGNDPSYMPQNGGTTSKERYTTTYFFDYQESTERAADSPNDRLDKDGSGGRVKDSPLVAEDPEVLTTEVWLMQELRLTEDANGLLELRSRLDTNSVALGQDDLNGDGDTTPVIAGNVIRVEHPTVNLLPGSNQAKIEGGTMQEIVELFVYNDFGQLIEETDPEGNETTYEYYSERDPDGDGILNGDPLGDPLTGGYLRRITRDAMLDPGRNSGTNPRSTSISTSYEYDIVGNVSREINGRNIATDYIVNELNEVVQIVHAADHVIESASIDFDFKDDGVYESYLEDGFNFVPKSPATRIELWSAAQERGLRLVANSEQNAISISKNGKPFTITSLQITHVDGQNGEWTISSEKGIRALPNVVGRVLFTEFADVTELEIFQTGATGSVVLDNISLVASPIEPLPSGDFGYLERFWYDFNGNLVLHQKEDRGNTSKVDGNPQIPDLLKLQIDLLTKRVDFEAGTDGIFESYSENGFKFIPSSNPDDIVTDPLRVELFTVSGNRGLRLVTDSNRERVRIKGVNGAPITLGGLRIKHLSGTDDEWVLESSAGGLQVLPNDSELNIFPGPQWHDVVEYEIYSTKGTGSILIDDLKFYANPDPVGGGRAFADVVYKYNILDNRIAMVQEVENGESPHFIRTQYRFDPNGNQTLTIFPEGNANKAIYDERDLLFRQGSGERTPGNQLDSGISSGGNTAATLRDNTKGWIENAWEGRTIWISNGKGKGQARSIISNTGNVLTVSPGWGVIPDATSAYEISLTLLAYLDPTDYDVRGGEPCDCKSYKYDGNRNVIETVDAADTDLSPDNDDPDVGYGDRTRYVYDGFDRLVSTVDAGGNQSVIQFDPAGNIVREHHFGLTGGPSPTSDGPDVLPGPVSTGGVIQSGNLVNSNLLSSTEYLYDELSRTFQTDQVLFVNTIPTVRTPNLADGAADLGKDNLTPGDNQAIPGVSGITIIGRVSTRTEFDRKSRPTFSVQDDRDVSRTFYDGVDRVIKKADPEGNTVESAYDDNHNLIEVRQIDIAQRGAGGGGKLQSGQSTGDNEVRTLNDTDQSWRPFEWAGRTLQVTGGKGAGHVRKIIDNTPDQLKVDEDWTVTPDATSTYDILPLSLLDNGQSTGANIETTLNDATKTWAVDEWKGQTVEITGGTGVGQVKKITGNNPFQLFVDPAWEEIPDASSYYAIYPRPQPGLAEVFLTTYFYDSLNRLQRQSDNLGQTMYYRYDSRDNLVAKADAQGPEGGTITRRAFSSGPLTVNDINGFGNVTRYFYDGLNRQTRQEIMLTASGTGDGVHIGSSTEGVKNDPGALESFLPPDYVDPTQGGGDGMIRIGATYDDNSLISAQIDDQGNVTLYLYDNLNRRVTETKGLMTATGSLNKMLILGSREIVTPTAATIDDPGVISTDKIDAQLMAAKIRLDKVAPLFPSLADEVDDSPPTTVVYGYDADSNVLILEDENDSEIFTMYDTQNRPIAVRVFRSGQEDTHAGDPIFAPNPVSDPSNPSTAFPPIVGTTKQNFQYDGLSRLVLATDDNDPLDTSDDSMVHYAFDSLNRLIEERQRIRAFTTKTISTGWRAGNLRTTLTYPNDRVINFSYDELDRIDTIVDKGGTDSLVDYNYLGAGRVLERRYPMNGIRLTYLDDSGTSDMGYDGLRRETQLRYLRSANSLVVGFAHSYDRMNNKLAEDKLHDPTNNETYEYDSASRLIGFDRPEAAALSPQHSTWDLDGAGNWTSVDAETRQHSSFNEITTRNVGGSPVTIAYDDNGNLFDNSTDTLQWDFSNRLCAVRRKPGGQIIAQYNYDATGRRIRKIVTNSDILDGTTFYYYDGQRVIEERNEAELLSQQYVYGNYIDEVLVMDRNLDGDDSAIGLDDQRLFFHQNGIMSVYALTDPDAKIVEGYLYDAYGRDRLYQPGANGVDFGDDAITVGGASLLDNPYLFTGRRLDPETGLFYYRRRYLDTDLGRFISRDLSGVWGDMINLGNGYAYVGNNGVNRKDPAGLFTDASGCPMDMSTESTRSPGGLDSPYWDIPYGVLPGQDPRIGGADYSLCHDWAIEIGDDDGPGGGSGRGDGDNGGNDGDSGHSGDEESGCFSAEGELNDCARTWCSELLPGRPPTESECNGSFCTVKTYPTPRVDWEKVLTIIITIQDAAGFRYLDPVEQCIFGSCPDETAAYMKCKNL